MLQRVARSIIYRAFGLLCYDERTEKAVPRETVTAPPEMRVIDPKQFGIFDPAIERVVSINDPAPNTFSLDDLLGRVNGRDFGLLSDRYDLAVSMLRPGTGICLDA